jgi:hypothetical protein
MGPFHVREAARGRARTFAEFESDYANRAMLGENV